MVSCIHCGTQAPEGALFCDRCGRTLPQGASSTPMPERSAGPTPAAVVGYSAPLPPPPPPPFLVPPPPEFVPPGLVGRAKHCARCNTLISSVAVVCPVCQADQP
ncbi:MAG: zinc ribbon domain-containing protein [Thermoplasmata archaeon]|nr:zinc ribbon domain-containing protein [Thermoplasmata archaeon]